MSNNAFDEGYEAAGKAILLEENPFGKGTDDHDLWEDGWWAYFYEEDEE